MPNYALSDFFRLEKIGEGTYGIVYKCRNRKSGQLKAMKRIKLENFDEGVPSTAIREIALLKELEHPNVVTLEQVILDRGRLYLIFEYLTLDLRRYLDNNCKDAGLPPDTVKLFMYQMLQALLYCHARRIIHRDLKPQNILVDVDRNVVKLADFGLARSFGYPLRKLTHEVVTLWYRSPEILLGETLYCCGVDMWSMGCMLAEIATGDPLFRGDSEIDQLFHIFRIMGMPTEENWPGVTKLRDYNSKSFPSWHTNKLRSQGKIVRALGAKGLDLLTALLLYDPASRINAQQALLHPYFADLDAELLPAVGEEFVGLPVDKIPSAIAEIFNAALTVADSELDVEEDEESMKEATTSDKRPRLAPSTVLLGASAYQISAARAKLAKERVETSKMERQEEAPEVKKWITQPLAENYHANMSID
ncbi:Cell division control protein [Echinococcus granulosus]|uniref:Cell division control protein n=1 Tax=Echinococcus granulosus TaxID=6210 RepID=W6U6G9_ECHGR|nr:Cell division control protein [Echinococcus granulosus]EUB56800.1 Cell division control protein [Echinococcus granulosus]